MIAPHFQMTSDFSPFRWSKKMKKGVAPRPNKVVDGCMLQYWFLLDRRKVQKDDDLASAIY